MFSWFAYFLVSAIVAGCLGFWVLCYRSFWTWVSGSTCVVLCAVFGGGCLPEFRFWVSAASKFVSTFWWAGVELCGIV